MNESSLAHHGHGRINQLAAPERGAVLIISLVLLSVLTFIAVTALNTSNFEEKMATNMQESHRAFQTAEAGIDTAFAIPSLFSLTVETSNSISGLGSYNASGVTKTAFEGWSNPPRGSGYSITSFSAAHFDMAATGSSGGGATARLHGGAYQIAPKAL